MGEIRKALERSVSSPIELQGAGRTDAGVHALGQVAHLRLQSKAALSNPQVLARINADLPYDIAILSIEPTHPKFHARHDALTRVYSYRLSLQKGAFTKDYSWWIKQPLDTALMAKAARAVVGRHDFQAFRAKDPAGGPEPSTIVVVDDATLELQGRQLIFRIAASHFLYRMVRRVTGAIVKVGLRELELADFCTLLEGRVDRRFDIAAWTAPAAGLFLEKVIYKDSASKAPQ
jgi:tRNA pseudouridine38-40 synthase